MQLWAELVWRSINAHRPFDLPRVSPDGRTVFIENGDLALNDLRVAEAVPNVGVLGHQAQRLLLATTDQDRDVAGRCRIEGGQTRLDSGSAWARSANREPAVPNSYP